MASSRSIGNVYAELTVKDKMTPGLNKAGKSLAAFGARLAAAAPAAAVTAVAAAVGGLVVATKKAIDTGGELADMMARTGADGEKLFVMQRAFENAGVAASKVPAVLNKMQKELAANNEEFAKLGLIAGNLKNMDGASAFRSTAEAIAKLPNAADRAAAAIKIFGKAGGEMLAVMTDPEAFAIAEKQVGKLGKFMAENAANLDKMGDTLSIVGSKMIEVGAVIAIELLPYIQKMADAFSELDLISKTQEFFAISKSIKAVAEEVGGLVAKMPGLKPFVALWEMASEPSIKEQQDVLDRIVKENKARLDAEKPFMAREVSGWGDNPAFNRPFEEFIPTFPEITPALRTDELGIPLISDMLKQLPYEIGVATGEAVTTAEASPAADFRETSYEVNSMQARGFGNGAVGVVRDANNQVSLLQQIRDVLKNAKIQDKQLVWDT